MAKPRAAQAVLFSKILNHQVTTALTLMSGMDRGDKLLRDVRGKGGGAFFPSVFVLLRHQILRTFLCGGSSASMYV